MNIVIFVPTISSSSEGGHATLGRGLGSAAATRRACVSARPASPSARCTDVATRFNCSTAHDGLTQWELVAPPARFLDAVGEA